MQKTKIGISVALFGAALYLMGLFGGYTIVIIMAGYILLFEENEWLKKAAVKAIAVMVLFGLIKTILSFVPSAISFVDYIFSMFGGDFRIGFVSNFINAVVTVLNVVEKLLMLGLSAKALNQGTIEVPLIDKLIEKHME